MNEITELPEGIKVLRRFRLNGLPISQGRFNRLVDKLNKCADGGSQGIKCDYCLYFKECVDRFDAICSRVLVMKEEQEDELENDMAGANSFTKAVA